MMGLLEMHPFLREHEQPARRSFHQAHSSNQGTMTLFKCYKLSRISHIYQLTQHDP